jgi:hypothetical protein
MKNDRRPVRKAQVQIPTFNQREQPLYQHCGYRCYHPELTGYGTLHTFSVVRKMAGNAEICHSYKLQGITPRGSTAEVSLDRKERPILSIPVIICYRTIL